MKLLVIIGVLAVLSSCTVHAKQHPSVTYALNAGGPAHVGFNNIEYASDEEDGQASPAGIAAHVPIPGMRCHPDDVPLYQSERYATSSFGYQVPTPADGDYVLVLKFAEAYFREANQKVFNVELNNAHTVVEELDIFGKVGYGISHDEYVPFSIKGGYMKVGEESSPVKDTFELSLVKGYFDNPKICAFLVVKGNVDTAKSLSPLRDLPTAEESAEEDEEVVDEEDFDNEMVEEIEAERKARRDQAAKKNPYEDEDGFPYLSVIIGFVAVVVVKIIFF